MTTVPHPTEKHSAVTPLSSYDWDTGAYTYNVPAMDPGQIWRTAVALAATKARQALPDSTSRIDKALDLVLHDAVELLGDGKARIPSQQNGSKTYTVCNGLCDCPDYARAPQGQCKHRLARALVLRAREIAKTLGQATSPVTLTRDDLVREPDAAQDDMPTLEMEPVTPLPPAVSPIVDLPAGTTPQLQPAFLVTIQGKPFITFPGLLDLAHQQGLLSLTEEVTHVTDTYVMAQARAEFHDGRVFRGVGDSAPDNVGKQVKPHWRRLAETRAMARCLRNALNINLCSVEELE